MQPRVFPPLVEAFLILEQPRQRLSHWTQAIAPLDDDRAPPLATVTAYYDPTCDQALLGLRYDELALGPERLAFVVEVALLAEIGMIQPSELSEGDRRRFLGERLARCTVSVTDQRNVVSALGELVRRIRDQRQTRPPAAAEEASRVVKPPPAPVIPMLAAAARTRGGAPVEDDPDDDGAELIAAAGLGLRVQPSSTRDQLDRLRKQQMVNLAKATRDVTPQSLDAIAQSRADRPGNERTEPMPLVPVARRTTAQGVGAPETVDLRRAGPPPLPPRPRRPLQPGTPTAQLNPPPAPAAPTRATGTPPRPEPVTPPPSIVVTPPPPPGSATMRPPGGPTTMRMGAASRAPAPATRPPPAGGPPHTRPGTSSAQGTPGAAPGPKLPPTSAPHTIARAPSPSPRQPVPPSPATVPRASTEIPRLEPAPAEPAPPEGRDPRLAHGSRPPGGRAATVPPSPHVIPRASTSIPRIDLAPPHVHRAATVQMDPAVVQQLASAADTTPNRAPVPPEALPPPATAHAGLATPAESRNRMTTDLPVAPEPPPPPPAAVVAATPPAPRVTTAEAFEDPYGPAVARAPLAHNQIYARYLRSGRWAPLRIGALSLRGAALMAGALPRLHDRVDLALAFGDLRAFVRGPVHKVSTQEETAQTGAASFSVTFELDDKARRQLTALLTAARAAGVTIKPPPPRRDRRFPVEWPVCLGTSRGMIRGEVLDVSRDGMFVRPANALTLDTNVSFSAVLDDGGTPVTGRSRVVRYLNEADARNCGLAQGYGLRISDMAEGDRARWRAFLHRIERRAEKRVLIGVAPGRLLELQAALTAAGYAAVGATDPDALVALAAAETSADACLIDAGWLPPTAASTWPQVLFPGRDVPCVAIRSGDVRRAREALDHALSIG